MLIEKGELAVRLIFLAAYWYETERGILGFRKLEVYLIWSD